MKTLEDALEEIRPTPDPEFVADMERRMRLGFPRERKRRLPAFRPRPFAAVAASAGLAVLVAVAVLDSGEEPTAPTALQPQAPAAAESLSDDSAGRAAEPGTTLSQPIPPPVGGGDTAPGTDIRRIERSAQLTLASDPDEFDSLADAIFRTADRRDGFVLQSSFTQGEEGFSSGFFELRVPSSQLQPTLNELSRLATVRARSESGTDVTGSFVSVRDRLRTALALRTSLLRRLELAVTDTAADAIRRRLGIVGNRIGGLRDQLRGVRERTEYATVHVELVDEDAGAAVSETDDAVDDAVGSLEDILNFLIRVGGVVLPLALAGGIGWLVVARARRRARERALA
jgi:Domain of unknown function (DUF4349)